MATLTLLLKKDEPGSRAKPTVPSAWHCQAGKQVPVKCRTAGRYALGDRQQDGVLSGVDSGMVCPRGWTAEGRGGEAFFNANFLFRIQFPQLGR